MGLAQVVAGHGGCFCHVAAGLKVEDVPFHIFPSGKVAISAVAIVVLKVFFIFFYLFISLQEVLESESGFPV